MNKVKKEEKRRERRAARLARKQKKAFENPLPGYLFSLEEFGKADSACLLKALFAVLPEDGILASLPPARRWQSGVGRKPFPRRALLRSLMARLAIRVPSYAALAERLSQDLSLKYECGFDMSRPAPSPDVLEDFAQLIGTHRNLLAGAHAQVIRHLAERLPGLGKDTSWDSTHAPVLAPGEASTPGPRTQATQNASAESAHAGETRSATDAVSAEKADSRPDAGPAGETKWPHEPALPATPKSAAADSTPSLSTSAGTTEKKGEPAGRNKTRRLQTRKPSSASDPSPTDKATGKSPLPALQADWGVKTYESVKEKKIRLADGTTTDGIELTKVEIELHGGKMHAIIDNRYKIPLLIEVTPQSQGDCPMIVPMYRKLHKTHPWMETASAMVDKAGDSEEVHRVLVDELGITPFIPLREIPNRQAPANPNYAFAKTVYDRDRDTHLIDPRTGQYEECEAWGYDKNRQALKYRCPCHRMRKEGRVGPKELCPFLGAGCGASRGETPYSFWVPLKDNWRYYCPVPRESKRWKERYKERTTVERVNNLTKNPLQLGEKRLRSLTTAAGEAHLTGLFLCVRAVVALDWGAPEKVGTAVSHIPYRRHRLVV